MAKIFGIKPQPAPHHITERFENRGMIRNDNRFRVATISLYKDGTGAGAA